MGAALKPHHFQPGNRLGGRKTGSRNRLSEIALAALGEHFAVFGKEAIDRVYREEPATYLKIVASLCPRELVVERLNPMSDLSDDDLRFLEESLAARHAKLVSQVEPAPEPSEG